MSLPLLIVALPTLIALVTFVTARYLRRRSGNAISPLVDLSYNSWNGESDLLNPLESSADAAIQNFLRRFSQFSRKERKNFRARLSKDDFDTLLVFSSRMAILAMRSGDADPLRLGFTSIAVIDPARSDSRDMLIRLSILNYSAERFEADRRELFKTAEALAPREAAKVIKEFHRRREPEQALRKFGFQEVSTQTGVGLIQCGLHDYAPTVDFNPILFNIADILRADRYVPGIQLAQIPVPAWFQPASLDDTEKMERVFKTMRATAKVSGRLRPEHHHRADAQSFTVFLFECATEEDAAFLARLAVSSKKDAVAVLTHRRFLCLIGGRSFIGGVEAYETRESIQRFRDPIDNILKSVLGSS